MMRFIEIKDIVHELREQGVPIPIYYDKIKDDLPYDTRTISDILYVSQKCARGYFNPGLKHGRLLSTSLNRNIALGRELKEWLWVKDQRKFIVKLKGNSNQMNIDFVSIVNKLKAAKAFDE